MSNKLTPMLKEFLAFVPVFAGAALVAGLVDDRAISTIALSVLAFAAFFVYRSIFGGGSWQAKVYPGLLLVVAIAKFFWHS